MEAADPLIRINETAPVPGGDAIAAIVGEFIICGATTVVDIRTTRNPEKPFLYSPLGFLYACHAMLIKDLPEDERPREKLIEKGSTSLSDAEILAVFLGTGRQGKSAVELGRELISHFGSLRNLSRASTEELSRVDGIGPAKAAQLSAAFEFGQRVSRETFSDTPVTSPEDVFELLGHEMQRLSQESVRAILLNHRKKLIQITEVFIGTGNESFANPAEILRKAIGHAAHSLILVHNHPSGDPTPSQADREVTRKMKAACEAVGLEFTDHLVIGSRGADNAPPYFSFREAGLL